MRTLLIEAVGFAMLAAVVWIFGWQRPLVFAPLTPAPAEPATPAERRRKPLLPWRGEEPIEKISVSGPMAPDGRTPVQCDLPADQCKRNIASKGQGCCVFRSLEYAGRWQHVPALYDFPEWMISKGIEGGGHPRKAADLIARVATERGLPVPQFVNFEGGDPAILKAALASGRLACVTYNGRDPHYSGSVAHMVSLVHFDDNFCCIRDNNFVKEGELVWMTPAEFLQRWKAIGGGWAMVITDSSGPPPVPRN